MTIDTQNAPVEIRELSDTELDNVNGAFFGALFGALVAYAVGHPKETYGAIKWAWNKISSWF